VLSPACTACWPLHLLLQDEDVSSGRAAAGDDDAESSRSVPLLSKTAGIRDAGFILVGRKSWWVGLVLVIISGLVLSVTVVTAILD
jgi:hypothetical protein